MAEGLLAPGLEIPTARVLAYTYIYTFVPTKGYKASNPMLRSDASRDSSKGSRAFACIYTHHAEGPGYDLQLS